jgi:hypothetical protein
MPSLEEGQTPKDRAVERVAQEIAIAERDRIPTSRQMLTQLVTTNFGIPQADAANLVDEYCDENAPGVPVYLQDELESPFLKVMAVLNSVLGIAALWNGSRIWHMQGKSWPWFIFGAIFVGAAGYAWFKTIQREIAEAQTNSSST